MARIPLHEPLDPAHWRHLWEKASTQGLGRVSIIDCPGRPAEPGPYTGMTDVPFVLLCLGGSITVSRADGGSFVLRERDGCLWAAGTWVANWHADCPRYLRATFDHDHVFVALKDRALSRSDGSRPDIYGMAVPGPVEPATRGLLAGLAAVRWHPATALAAFTLAMWAVHEHLGLASAIPGRVHPTWPRLQALAARNPPPSRAAAARELNLAPETVSRLCRRQGDCTWMEVVDAARLARAELHMHGSEDLTAIAQQCGFASAGHLIRRFRLRHGLTPEVWRRRVRGGGT
jgi:AraC-like DNA-binding protein